jgi:hypothetical protein
LKDVHALRRMLATLTTQIRVMEETISHEEQQVSGVRDTLVEAMCPDLHPDTLRALLQQYPNFIPEGVLMRAAVRFRLFATEESYVRDLVAVRTQLKHHLRTPHAGQELKALESSSTTLNDLQTTAAIYEASEPPHMSDSVQSAPGQLSSNPANEEQGALSLRAEHHQADRAHHHDAHTPHANEHASPSAEQIASDETLGTFS